MAHEEQEALEKALSANLSRVIDWLKFAETKNAALLTFASAWLVATCTLWSNDKAPIAIKWALIPATPCIIFAASCSLLSFLPARQRKNLSEASQRLSADNLLYHKNLGGLSLEDAETKLRSRYKPQEGQKVSEELIKDLTVQLTSISAVANTKFDYFNRGALVIICGIIASSLLFLILLIWSLRSC